MDIDDAAQPCDYCEKCVNGMIIYNHNYLTCHDDYCEKCIHSMINKFCDCTKGIALRLVEMDSDCFCGYPITNCQCCFGNDDE